MKYLTSVMFYHAKAEAIVKEMYNALQKLAISLKLIFGLVMDVQSLNKSIGDM